MSQPLRVFEVRADVRPLGDDTWVVGQTILISAPSSISARLIAHDLLIRSGVECRNIEITERH